MGTPISPAANGCVISVGELVTPYTCQVRYWHIPELWLAKNAVRL